MDKKISPFEYMFLPDYVESGFDHATIRGRPIVKRKISVYEAREEIPSESLFHPWIIFGLFLLITITVTVFDWRTKKLNSWFDAALFFVAGLIGVLLLALWIATDHLAAAKNFNLLWALPSHLIASILLIKNGHQFFLAKYFAAVTVVSAGTLLFWPFFPQYLNVFLVPFVIALGLRAFTISSLLVRKL